MNYFSVFRYFITIFGKFGRIPKFLFCIGVMVRKRELGLNMYFLVNYIGGGFTDYFSSYSTFIQGKSFHFRLLLKSPGGATWSFYTRGSPSEAQHSTPKILLNFCENN